jgi:hypothetical protein
MAWKKHYNVRLSKNDFSLFDEIAVAEYHPLSTLNLLFGRGKGLYVRKRLMYLVEKLYLNRIPIAPAHGLGSHAFYLAQKAIEELRADDDTKERLRRINRRGNDRTDGRKLHDYYRAVVRTRLRLDKSLSLDRWVQRREAGMLGEVPDGEKKAQRGTEPDCFFTLGNGNAYALEVDLATYAVERASLDQGSSILEKLLVYESVLSDRDCNGKRWRIDHLGVPFFAPLFFKPRTNSANPDLATQRFQNTRRVIKKNDLKEVRRAILFADDAWQEWGQPFQVEDYRRRRFALSSS